LFDTILVLFKLIYEKIRIYIANIISKMVVYTIIGLDAERVHNLACYGAVLFCSVYFLVFLSSRLRSVSMAMLMVISCLLMCMAYL